MTIALVVEQADRIVQESGDVENFDAARWVAVWLDEPHPALGNRCPRDFTGTDDGRALLSNLLARQQSRSYA